MTAGTECSELVRATDFSRVARRNNSLSSSGRLLVFAILFAVSVGIACAFAAFGAWLILPFAGLEMLVLYAAFWYVGRHAADYERIAVAGDRLRVEINEAGRASNHEFNRWWAQVVLSGDSRRLALRYQGRELEIGRYLNDEQRLTLARDLRVAVRH